MKCEKKHRGSAVSGLARYDFNIEADTIEEVRQLALLYEYKDEGLRLILNPDHTGFRIEVGKYPHDTPPPPIAGSPR
jgi:hypothetical protein